MAHVAQTARARFDCKVDRSRGDDVCHLWTASCGGPGYGKFYLNGVGMDAHRAAWILTNGPIPDGMWVLHTCDVRRCVNPRHLFLGTVQDNHNDMWAKGRGPAGARRLNQPKGEAHHAATTTAHAVAEIRRRAAAGEQPSVLAKEFGMSAGNARKIVRGAVWRHVQH